MAVINATKVKATANELIYTFTGTGADTGTITYATLVADAATGPLKTVLASLAGQTDSNAKAVSALITGEAFTGAGTGTPTLTSDIEVKLVSGVATAVPTIAATDDGATNNPQYAFATAGVGVCWLYIRHNHSIIL